MFPLGGVYGKEEDTSYMVYLFVVFELGPCWAMTSGAQRLGRLTPPTVSDPCSSA